MKYGVLFDVQQAGEVDPEAGIADPHAWRCQRDRESRQHRERPLVEESEVCWINWITPETDTKRVEDRVAFGVALAHLSEIVRHQ